MDEIWTGGETQLRTEEPRYVRSGGAEASCGCGAAAVWQCPAAQPGTRIISRQPGLGLQLPASSLSRIENRVQVLYIRPLHGIPTACNPPRICEGPLQQMEPTQTGLQTGTTFDCSFSIYNNVQFNCPRFQSRSSPSLPGDSSARFSFQNTVRGLQSAPNSSPAVRIREARQAAVLVGRLRLSLSPLLSSLHHPQSSQRSKRRTRQLKFDIRISGGKIIDK